MFTSLVETCRRVGPHIKWEALMENVASMTAKDRATITDLVNQTYPATLYRIDANILGPVNRPRFYWTSFEFAASEFLCNHTDKGYVELLKRGQWKPGAEGFLDKGVV